MAGSRPGQATSAAYNACEVIYREMAARAVPVEQAPPHLRDQVPAAAVAVFVGCLLPLVTQDLGMTSHQQYHTRKLELRAMGCILQLERGRRYKNGAWALLQPPSLQAWDAHVRRPFSRRREAALVERHREALKGWLVDAHRTHPVLVREAVEVAGVRTRGELLAYVAQLPERRLRVLFPAGEVCPGFAGGVHVCRVAGLDLVAPSRAAGAWHRRAVRPAEGSGAA